MWRSLFLRIICGRRVSHLGVCPPLCAPTAGTSDLSRENKFTRCKNNVCDIATSSIDIIQHPSKHWPHVDLTLDQRLRRWPNVKSTRVFVYPGGGIWSLIFPCISSDPREKNGGRLASNHVSPRPRLNSWWQMPLCSFCCSGYSIFLPVRCTRYLPVTCRLAVQVGQVISPCSRSAEKWGFCAQNVLSFACLFCRGNVDILLIFL